MLAPETLWEHIEGKLTTPHARLLTNTPVLWLAEAKALLLQAHNAPQIINIILDRLATLVCCIPS